MDLKLRFLVFGVLICLPGPAMSEETALDRYRDARTAEEMVRAEIESEWIGAKWDPSKFPKYFDCNVETVLANFEPDELAAIETFAKDRNSRNRAAQWKALQKRDNRLDIKAAIDASCSKYRGS